MIPLIAYTDRFSVRAGGAIALKASTSHPEYRADLVRIRSADPNPAGPGMRFEDVQAAFAGSYKGRVQAAASGSHAVIDMSGLPLGRHWTLSLRVQPWLLDGSPQAVLGWEGVSLHITRDGLTLRFGEHTLQQDCAFLERRWYQIRLSFGPAAVGMTVDKLHEDWGRAGTPGPHLYASRTGDYATGDAPAFAPRRLLLAAAPDANGTPRDHFNGRLEHPVILDGDRAGAPGIVEPAQLPRTHIHAWWNFALAQDTADILDQGPHRRHGRLVNMPTRASRGAFWSGRELNWHHAPEEYAAIHFHEDDLYDCGWDTDFTFQTPPDLPSGVYGIRLRAGKDEDIVPFFVLPPTGTATAKVALLFSTYTYQVYANYDRGNYDDAYRERRAAWPGSYPHHPGDNAQFGLSTYNWHIDGSGVAHSSHLRPILTFRPGYLAYPDQRGSGLRHFPADMHLAAWLDAKGIAWDAITDHDVEAEGPDLLARYKTVLTPSHPEYQSLGTLDALCDYTANGGRLMYLGGNGFYWRVATSPHVPGTLELRRTESGTRAWAADPGEYYHQFDGGYGGLWRRQDRAPQKLAGVGFSAQGRFEGSFYRRLPDSHADDVAWIFDGVEGEIIGDFGFSGGGAAGFELDRADPLLGSPPNTIVLCRSEGHQAHFGVTPEDVLQPRENKMTNEPDPLIRSDMVYFTTARGGAVFSVGSITFCGSLPWNNFDNQISTLIGNVVTRFMKD